MTEQKYRAVVRTADGRQMYGTLTDVQSAREEISATFTEDRIERPVPTTDEPDHHLYRAVRLTDGVVAGPWMPGERAQISDQTEWREEMSSVRGWIAVAPEHPSLPTHEQIAEALYRQQQRPAVRIVWSELPEWVRSVYFDMADAVLTLIQKGADREWPAADDGSDLTWRERNGADRG